MFRTCGFLVPTLLFCACLQAATPINTTITIEAIEGPQNGTPTSITIAGSARYNPGIPDVTGAFSANFSIASTTATTVSGSFTIQMSEGNLTGTITLPTAFLLGTTATGTGSASITGGTGTTYSGSTGSFSSLSGSSLGSASTGLVFSFTGSGSITTGGSGGSGTPTSGPTPTVTAVLDAGSYTSGITEGGIFVVKGSNLSASGYDSSGFPLLATYNNAGITLTPTSGGTGTSAYMLYTYNQSGVNQLAAVLPSTLAAGSYNLTVTNNGSTSAPFAVQVAKSKPGLFTQDATGSGLAIVQNYISATELDIDRFTTGTVSGVTISPAKPGQALIAWGTGLGPVPGGDNVGSAGYDFLKNGANVQAIVGGMSITPAYAGRGPTLAGVDQIVFTLPSNVPTGCTVSFQISVNGVLSNPTFIAIAPDANSNACVLAGFTTSELQQLDQGGYYTAGNFSVISETSPEAAAPYASASGVFTRYTGFELAAATSSSTSTTSTSGSCTVDTVTSGPGTVAVSGSAVSVALDAGTITLTGPAGSGLANTPLTETNNDYVLTIGTGLGIPGAVNGSIVAGTYTLNGAGGQDVGKFTASINLGNPLVVTGGLPSTVVRSQGLTLNWTGGNASDQLEIIGSTGSIAAGVTTSVSFICTTTAGAQTFTVPPSILTQLPAASSSGTLLEITTGALSSFSAPLTAGGSIGLGVFVGVTGAANNPAYQ
jgi:uncharacterized protein (TIGR03437 family)